MKSKLKIISLLLFGFLFFVQSIFGQENRYGAGLNSDPKWYVLDGKTQDLNNDSSQESVRNQIILKNIGAPNANVREELHDDRARDDVFVIFADGNHYNSRPIHVQNLDGLSFSPHPPPFEQMYNFRYYRSNLALNFQYASHIDYLYLTDVYDEDPPPRSIRIHTSGVIEDETDFIPLENVNTIPDNLLGTQSILSANHDITLNSDLVIIINKDKLKGTKYVLKYKTITNSDNKKTRNPPIVLEPSPVFITEGNTASASLPDTPSQTNPPGEFYFKKITDDSTDYIYLCLRTINEKIKPFLPGEKNEVKKVVFELYKVDKEGKTPDALIATHEEEIHAAHDPNGLYATQLCRDAAKNEYVRYFLQFQNTSKTSISDYSALFTLPSGLDANSIYIVAFSVGSNNMGPKQPLGINGQEVTFQWENAPIQSKNVDKTTKEDIESIVTVEFCVRKKNSTDLNLMDDNLNASNAKTLFGLIPYNLTTGDKTYTNLEESKPNTFVWKREFKNCTDCSRAKPAKKNFCKRLRDRFRKNRKLKN